MTKRQFLLEESYTGMRLAVFEDGELCRIRTERAYDEAGRICLGRVERVVKALGAAFVDIGSKPYGFLPLADLGPGETLRAGDAVLVQIRSGPVGDKGPRLTLKPTLSGELLVLTPGDKRIALSRKIESEETRAGLRSLLLPRASESGAGAILRTSSAHASPDAIEMEYDSLLAIWHEIEGRARYALAPCTLYEKQSIIAELMNARSLSESEIIADGKALYLKLTEALAGRPDDERPALRCHEGEIPLFSLYRADAKARALMERRQWLPCGGELVIDEAEALTAIDVNSARSGGYVDEEEMALSVNLEAAELIARILRFRNIGGIVIVDFINMDLASSKERLLARMRELTARDEVPVVVLDITPLGLLEMTRKRSGASVSALTRPSCPLCKGSGSLPSVHVQVEEALREIWMARRRGDQAMYLIEGDDESLEELKSYDLKDEAVWFLPCAQRGCRVRKCDSPMLPRNAFMLAKRG